MPKFIFIFILLLPSFLIAQEKQEKEGETLTQVAQKKSDEKKSKSSKSSSDDYKASEEISEDLSVSYPVDI
ncbi:hypothetical protein [Microbulbifer variabilis]|uniref:hypothetical protein n=1 Tax=Microbulbifer variabilis TaxID=266805 RepID=UPI000370E22C|nr:hypothetical protein [Microbulbifer variabilis]